MTGKKVKAVDSKFDHYEFQDDGFSCKIVPSMGGSIQELIVNDIQIIDGASLNEAGLITYSRFYNAALLFPFPNRIAYGRYTLHEKTFQLNLNDGLEQHAIHGLLSDRLFQEVAYSDNSLDLEYRSKGDPGYPFPFSFKVRYEFSKSMVNISFYITNNGTDNLPFGIGWHPYFKATNAENFSVQFIPDKQYVMSDDLIPKDSEKIGIQKLDLAEIDMDDAFRLTSGKIEVQDENYSLTMTVSDDSYLQIFTPADKKSVAIEPMTCIGNSFNNGVGLKHLKPNQSFQWTIKLDFH